MALVGYSDSESENEEEHGVVETELLSLPKASSLQLPSFKPNNDHIDNPDLHQGRMRGFSHKRGNWPSFVYIKYNQILNLQGLSVTLLGLLSSYGLEFHQIEEPHLSLSKTFVLFHHWIDTFVEEMKKSLSCRKRFRLHFDNCDFLVNDEKTRSFLTLNVSKEDEDILLDICSDVDKNLQLFKAEKYYDDPKFHISLSWCLGDISSILTDKELEALKAECCNVTIDAYASVLSCEFNEVFLNIGNRIYRLPLL